MKKIRVTKRQLQEMLTESILKKELNRKVLNEALADASVVNDPKLIDLIRQRTGSIKAAIEQMHNSASTSSVDITQLKTDIQNATRKFRPLKKKLTNSNYQVLVPWINSFLINLGNDILDADVAPPEADAIKAAEDALSAQDALKNANSSTELIKDIVFAINSARGTISFVQAALDLMESTTFSFSDKADEWEIATLLIATHYLGEGFRHTGTQSEGVDIAGPIKIEVKSSEDSSPQTMFSASLPVAEDNKFYFFITTGRCYFVESRSLRSYFLNIEGTSDDYQITGTDGMAINKKDISKILVNSDQYRSEFTGITTGAELEAAILNITDEPGLAKMYDAIKADVQKNVDNIAGLVFQVLTGVSASNDETIDGGSRIIAPSFGFGGLKVGFRVQSRKSLGEIKNTLPNILEEIKQNDLQHLSLLILSLSQIKLKNPEEIPFSFSEQDVTTLTRKTAEIINNFFLNGTDQQKVDCFRLLDETDDNQVSAGLSYLSSQKNAIASLIYAASPIIMKQPDYAQEYTEYAQSVLTNRGYPAHTFFNWLKIQIPFLTISRSKGTQIKKANTQVALALDTLVSAINEDAKITSKELYSNVLLDLMEASAKKQRATNQPKKIKLTKGQLQELTRRQLK